jgi:hypothetical protein
MHIQSLTLVSSLCPPILQRDAVNVDPRETSAGTINRGKASGRLVPISYMLNVCEVYSNAVKLSYE